MIETYDKNELEALERHISRYFGSYSQVFHELVSPDIHLDIGIIPPTPQRNCYTLVTMGMGAHCMQVPRELTEQKLSRAELVLSLPADWRLDDSAEEWYWPIRWMKLLARLPIAEDSWLGWGHTVANPSDQPFADNTGFSGILLLSPGEYADEAAVCVLPDGDEVNFYEMIPLYREEMDFKCRYGAQALLQRLEEDTEEIRLHPLDLSRKNVCAHKKKAFLRKAEEIRPLLTGWNGPEGCIATDRITVDGDRVGYCYREKPDEEAAPWDSGWRFTAGDESDGYMDDPENSGIYALNTICNYDPAVAPLLRAPYGSAFTRTEAGEWERAEGSKEIPAPFESLLGEEEVRTLNSFMEDVSGYFGRMIQYLEQFISTGVQEGRFTEREAYSDRDIALWYAYACNNIDDYPHYYLATQWMPASEKNAKGCGAWYYRYSCALLYCSRLEEALDYAEKGVLEEPDYPWGWLQLAKLRSHFGDRAGALQAVETGLGLVPRDYEFITLRREIQQGRSIEEMEYHYIDPESDRALQAGENPDGVEKRRAIAGIRCDKEALKQIKALFSPADWTADAPYCSFHFTVGGQELEGVFRMNEAALSKMDPAWLLMQKIALEKALIYRDEEEESYRLQTLLIDQDQSVHLLYRNEEGSRAFQIQTQESGEPVCSPQRIWLENSLEEPDEEELEEAPMVKLYRREPDGISYAECWLDGNYIVEHTGRVGEMGETIRLPCPSADAYPGFLEAFCDRYGIEEYVPWPQEEEGWIVAQFPMQPVNLNANPPAPAPEDLALREEGEHLLGEALGWTGLGYVDGWEMGKQSDDPSRFVLNFYCAVVELETGISVIRRALEQAVDCRHLKIAAKAAEEEEYTLVYSADQSEDFSL